MLNFFYRGMTFSLSHILHPVVSRVVLVERDELPALIFSFGYFFCLLAAYYILRPVRDEMGVLSGVHALPWLFSMVFLAMLVVIPLFGWIAGHLTIRRLLLTVYAFFIFNLFAFFVALRSGMGLQAVGPIFFVWLSVFNLFVVSVFWVSWLMCFLLMWPVDSLDAFPREAVLAPLPVRLSQLSL